jgi:ferritin heavy chain
MHLLASISMIMMLLFFESLSFRSSDPHLSNYLEEEFIEEQVIEYIQNRIFSLFCFFKVKSLKEYGDYITNLRRVGPGLGEYVFDKEEFED